MVDSHTMSRRRVLAGTAAAATGVLVGGRSALGLGRRRHGLTAPATSSDSLSVSHWLGGLWDSWVELLEEKTGVELSGQNTPYGEYPQKLLTQLASGTAPDVMLLEAAMNGEFFPSGLLAPVGDHLASAGLDMSKWNVDPMLEVGYGGELLGFPIFTSVDRIVHVNVELAERTACWPTRRCGAPTDSTRGTGRPSSSG